MDQRGDYQKARELLKALLTCKTSGSRGHDGLQKDKKRKIHPSDPEEGSKRKRTNPSPPVFPPTEEQTFTRPYSPSLHSTATAPFLSIPPSCKPSSPPLQLSAEPLPDLEPEICHTATAPFLSIPPSCKPSSPPLQLSAEPLPDLEPEICHTATAPFLSIPPSCKPSSPPLQLSAEPLPDLEPEICHTGDYQKARELLKALLTCKTSGSRGHDGRKKDKKRKIHPSDPEEGSKRKRTNLSPPVFPPTPEEQTFTRPYSPSLYSAATAPFLSIPPSCKPSSPPLQLSAEPLPDLEPEICHTATAPFLSIPPSCKPSSPPLQLSAEPLPDLEPEICHTGDYQMARELPKSSLTCKTSRSRGRDGRKKDKKRKIHPSDPEEGSKRKRTNLSPPVFPPTPEEQTFTRPYSPSLYFAGDYQMARELPKSSLTCKTSRSRGRDGRKKDKKRKIHPSDPEEGSKRKRTNLSPPVFPPTPEEQTFTRPYSPSLYFAAAAPFLSIPPSCKPSSPPLQLSAEPLPDLEPEICHTAPSSRGLPSMKSEPLSLTFSPATVSHDVHSFIPTFNLGSTDARPVPHSEAQLHILTLLEHIVVQQAQLVAAVNHLLARVEAPEAEIPTDVKLPVTTMSEVEDLEWWLQDERNSHAKENLVSALGIVGGQSVKKMTWNLLSMIFTNTVAKQINWRGVNGKKSFKDMQTRDLLLKAVRKNRFAHNALDCEIDKHAIRFFNLAISRGGHKDHQRAPEALSEKW